LNKRVEDTQLHNILTKSPEAIAELLRSAAHPVRIKVLALLLQRKQSFSELMQYTGLAKTALANHINHLTRKGLVQRITRGEYSLTVDGEELLNASASVYKNSAWRQEEERKLLRRRYTKAFIEGKQLSEKVISKKAEYQACWLSYTGAIAGSLRALGIDCDTVDVGGYSGYAFLINVAKGSTCPSGPTALPPETWKQIHKGTESLGWTIEHYEYPHSYPAKEGNPTPEEIEIAKKIFERIKREIDERDRPVVLWGLVAPEYGIVKGYDGNSYITSTFRSLQNPRKPEDLISFHDLKAPGCIDAFFFREKAEVVATEADKKALKRAVDFATANVPILKNYVGGPAALDEWANVLENLPGEEQNYMGNSYVAACVTEARWMAAEFLKRLAKRYTGKQSTRLREAAECYEKGTKIMQEFTQIFPFKHQGKMKLEQRKKGGEILRKAKPFEKEAIKHLKRALEE
jgi:DNA-binding HxlR family transcriptional regulator